MGHAQRQSHGRGGVRPGRWASASSSASATGARTSWWSSAPWRPTPCPPRAARPLIAAFPKMLMPFIVIVPGHRRRWRSTQMGGRLRAAHARATSYDYDQVLTTLMAQFYPVRHAGRRPDRAGGVVHVRHGRQRHGFQHRLDLRHLPELHPARRPRLRTTYGGPHGDGRRHRAVHRRRLPGAALQQHHGLAATGVRLRQRAAVRHLPAGHVLEARHGPRRVHRAGVRHGGRRR